MSKTGDICVICCEDLESKESVSPTNQCINHKIHQDCFDDYSKHVYERKCPICQKKDIYEYSKLSEDNKTDAIISVYPRLLERQYASVQESEAYEQAYNTMLNELD